MCIRDRDEAGNVDAHRAAGDARLVRAHQAAVGLALRVLEACLLYTSDAADERSSVDLGGRRIIKKKKKKVSSAQH